MNHDFAMMQATKSPNAGEPVKLTPKAKKSLKDNLDFPGFYLLRN